MDSQANHFVKEITVHPRKAKNDFPFEPREGCVACAMGSQVYVFGGVIQSNLGEPQETNDLLLFTVDTEAWQKVKVSGSPPPARAAASLVAVGSKLYLFGGLSHMTGWFNDTFVFDTETREWSQVETTGNLPSGRDKLQGVAVGSVIYYFGGFGPKTDGLQELEEDLEEEDEEEDMVPEAAEQEAAEFGWFNDLYAFDTEKKCWSQPILANLDIPTSRAAHGMCAIGSKLYVFGGRDFTDRQNDLHSFDLASGQWKLEESTEGDPPQPRSFHTATAAGRHVLVIGGRGRDNSHFADLHAFDSETNRWLQPKVQGPLMSARGQHIAVMAGKTLVVFGGTGDFSADIMQCQQFYTDTFLLSFDDGSQGDAASANGNGEA